LTISTYLKEMNANLNFMLNVVYRNIMDDSLDIKHKIDYLYMESSRPISKDCF